MKDTILTVDEYIFLSWLRSLSKEEQDLFIGLLKNDDTQLPSSSIAFVQSYPHDLFDIAKSIGGN